MDLEVQERSKINSKEIIFNESTKKESIIYAAYYYIRQLYENNLLSLKELNNIKQKYNISIE